MAMDFVGPYQIAQLDKDATVATVSDSATLAASVNNGLAKAEENAKVHANEEIAKDRGRLVDVEAKNTTQDNRLVDVEAKNTTQDNRLVDVEAKNTTQDNRLDELPNQYVPLTRGVLPDGTDLNTLNGNTHVGTYSLMLNAYNYPNAPVPALDSTAAVLEVQRGAGNALVQRITAATIMVWREAGADGTWSGWEQVATKSFVDAQDSANRAAWAAADETNLSAAKTYTNAEVAKDRTRLSSVETKNTEQDGRLTSVEAKNATQDGRLSTTEAKGAARDGRLGRLESVAPKVSNIALDSDGTPIYSPGSTDVHVVLDGDGTPYYFAFLSASVAPDGTLQLN